MPFDTTGFQKTTRKKKLGIRAGRDLERLRQVKRAITAGLWVKKTYGSGGAERPHCIVGHCRAVAGSRQAGDGLAKRRLLPMVPLGSSFPPTAPASLGRLWPLIVWNDEDARQEDEIIWLVEQAISKIESEGR